MAAAERLTYSPADDDVLTAEEVARYLRVSPATIYKQMAMSRDCPEHIPFVAIGRRRVIVFWQLKAWLATQAGVSMPVKLTKLQH